MATSPKSNWKEEFGIDDRKSADFVANIATLDAMGASAPQPHALRRAFEQFSLDGVLCKAKTPLVYFKLVDAIVADEAIRLHRLFWNQGVASILVLIDPGEVHVYSGLLQPDPAHSGSATPPGLIERIERLSPLLRRFLLAVETGEYFRVHRKSFDPQQRVDRNLLRDLRATRDRLDVVPAPRLAPHTLNALLCRLVFTCYLFDRDIIDGQYLSDAGIADAKHLRDILCGKPGSQAKANLYRLFAQLGRDFNGDLFSDDLEAEARQVKVDHLDVLSEFFHGTNPCSGQQSFWPYEFGIIPIETISSIYEHFLKAAGVQEKKDSGAFYTPRFLAELVLDVTVDGTASLLGKRYLDPACGSGIFLVGLFNRLAEEWDRTNKGATYDTKLRALTEILKTNLFGIDKNRTACLIAAFSLYLALLDQLSPRDIRRVLKKVKVLPRLVGDAPGGGLTIRCVDFFDAAAELPQKVHFIVGNPPWAQVKDDSAPVAAWVDASKLPFPGRQIATAFVWKAPEHLEAGGKVCFVLPHGMLFNHTPKAVAYQQQLFTRHAVELVLNLADYQRFLFEDAEAPAVVIRYGGAKPTDSSHRIDYWTPKTDWSVTQAEIITVEPQDRRTLLVREVLTDLRGPDAPLIWKERYWATERDGRLIERLLLYPRLRDLIGKRADREPKRWIIAEGFEPFGENDPPGTRRSLCLQDAARVEATTHPLDLVLLPNDAKIEKSLNLDLRRAISDPSIFSAPLVLVTEGFSQIAFADFNVAYRHGIRGIHGPARDRSMLALLTVYLRSAVARHFLFHTSGSWGISRARVDVDDLLRLPFPLPEEAADPARAAAIVKEVGSILSGAAKEAVAASLGRDSIIAAAQAEAEPLVEEYLDLDDVERMLVRDTNDVIIPSARPTRSRTDVPTIRPVTDVQRSEYVRVLCATLNGRASKSYRVHGISAADGGVGIGLIVLEKTRRDGPATQIDGTPLDVLAVMAALRRNVAKELGTLELARGLKVFEGGLLYITKPLGQRFWTATAALNDADEIESTVFLRSLRGKA